MTRQKDIVPKDFDVNFLRFEDTAEEEATGNCCPNCGYPTVIECGFEVCYRCGWAKDEDEGI